MKVLILFCLALIAGTNASRRVCYPVEPTPSPVCSLTCEENYVPNENCDECQCALTQDSCEIDQPGTMLVGCECIYVDPCFEQSCSEGEKWNFTECKCVHVEIVCAPCPNENDLLDRSDCSCHCPITEESCTQEGGRFVESECLCITTGTPCEPCLGENYYLDSRDCSCHCGLSAEICSFSNWGFNEDQCVCTPSNCDYIMECPLGQKWDLGVCGCVPIVCENSDPCGEFFVFNENCECIPAGPFCEPCPNEYYYQGVGDCSCHCGLNQEICDAQFGDFIENECICKTRDWGCDYIMECPLGQKWDFGVCGCIPIVCENLECETNYVFNENCECQCAMTQERCDNELPGTMLIGCECIYVDPCFEQPCSTGEIWSFDECKCVPGIICEACANENYIQNGSDCSCQCVLNQEICDQQNARFIEDQCACMLVDYGCDYIMICPPGQRWDGSKEVCGCVPIVCENSPPCEGNFAYTEFCGCRCAMTQERCDIELPGSKLIGCECVPVEPCTQDKCDVEHPGTLLVGCDCIYDDPCFERTCSDGEQFDFDVCGCVRSSTTETPYVCVEQDCRNRYVWLPTECTCVCPPMYCEEGTTPGGDCECVPDPNYCSPIECANEGEMFDKESCSCIPIDDCQK